MTHNRAYIPDHITIDIFALFNRKELFARSTVCRRYNDIVNQKFANAPYLLFEELVHSDRWEWKPNKESDLTDMPTHLVALLKKSTFVRFKNTKWSSNNQPLIDELTPMKHVFEGQYLTIGKVIPGYPTVTANLVQKCRSLTFSEMKLIDFSLILPYILANDHDEVSLHVSSMGTKQLIMPVDDSVDFLFRQTSNGSRKLLSVYTNTPLDSENSAAIETAIKERFMASSEQFRFEFTLFSHVDDEEGINNSYERTYECKNQIGQILEIVLSNNNVECQVE